MRLQALLLAVITVAAIAVVSSANPVVAQAPSTLVIPAATVAALGDEIPTYVDIFADGSLCRGFPLTDADANGDIVVTIGGAGQPAACTSASAILAFRAYRGNAATSWILQYTAVLVPGEKYELTSFGPFPPHTPAIVRVPSDALAAISAKAGGSLQVVVGGIDCGSFALIPSTFSSEGDALFYVRPETLLCGLPGMPLAFRTASGALALETARIDRETPYDLTTLTLPVSPNPPDVGTGLAPAASPVPFTLLAALSGATLVVIALLAYRRPQNNVRLNG